MSCWEADVSNKTATLNTLRNLLRDYKAYSDLYDVLKDFASIDEAKDESAKQLQEIQVKYTQAQEQLEKVNRQADDARADIDKSKMVVKDHMDHAERITANAKADVESIKTNAAREAEATQKIHSEHFNKMSIAKEKLLKEIHDLKEEINKYSGEIVTLRVTLTDLTGRRDRLKAGLAALG
jgi:chromosome segregation ATPase